MMIVSAEVVCRSIYAYFGEDSARGMSVLDWVFGIRWMADGRLPPAGGAQLFDNWCEQILIDTYTYTQADKLAIYHIEADKLQSKPVLLPLADASADLSSDQDADTDANTGILVRTSRGGWIGAIDTLATHSFSHCSRSQFPYIFPWFFIISLLCVCIFFFVQTKVNSIESSWSEGRMSTSRRSMPQ